MNCIVIFVLLPLLLDKFHICKDPRKVNKDEDEDISVLYFHPHQAWADKNYMLTINSNEEDTM